MLEQHVPSWRIQVRAAARANVNIFVMKPSKSRYSTSSPAPLIPARRASGGIGRRIEINSDSVICLFLSSRALYLTQCLLVHGVYAPEPGRGSCKSHGRVQVCELLKMLAHLPAYSDRHFLCPPVDGKINGYAAVSKSSGISVRTNSLFPH